MALNSEQVGWLVKMLQDTQDVEMSCGECAEQLDVYAQRIIDGEPLDDLLGQVREHLVACAGCDDVFRLILETIDAIDEE